MKNALYMILAIISVITIGILGNQYRDHFGPVRTVINSTESIPAGSITETTSTPGDPLPIGSSSNTITIVPVSVIEDSRCPTEGQCIWAGTVKLKATVKSGSQTKETVLVLGESQSMFGHAILLRGVTPEKHTTKTLSLADYRFDITVK